MNKTLKIALILLIVISVFSSALAAITFLGKQSEHLKRILLEEKLAGVLKDKQRIEKELDGVQKAKDALDLKLNELTKNTDMLSGELEKEKKKAVLAISEVEDKKKQLLRLTENLEDEKKEKQTLAKRLSGLQTEHEEAKIQLDRVQAEKTRLEKKVSELEKKSVELDKIVVKPQESIVTKPLLHGKVLVVNRDYNFVVTDLGNDDGISKGMLFEIQSDGQSLGRVEIDKIYETMSSATMLPGTRTLEVKKGDSVIEAKQL